MIGIVGGGLSGLFALDLLVRRGEEAILLERAAEPGGVALSRTVEGPSGPITVDLGPQRVRLTPGLAQVVEEVGLTPTVLRAREGIPFTVRYGGRLHPAPFGIGQAIRTGLISPLGKLRALADLVTPPPRPDESVADALRRKLGTEIHERLAGPILGGLYGSDPEEMDARHTLLPVLGRTGGGRSLLRALVRASRWESLPVVSFTGGMGALPRALAARHMGRIRLASPVRAIESAPGGGFLLHAEGETIAVDRVILSLPAPDAARVLGSLDPEVAGHLAVLRYNALAVVPLLVPPDAPVPEVGSGYKETLRSDAITRGVTAHGALFERRGLFSAFLGGMGRDDVVARPDQELMEIARLEFREVTGVDPVPLLAHRTWMPAWDRSWRALDGLRLPAGVAACAAWMHRPGIPGRLEDARATVDRLLQSSIAPR